MFTRALLVVVPGGGGASGTETIASRDRFGSLRKFVIVIETLSLRFIKVLRSVRQLVLTLIPCPFRWSFNSLAPENITVGRSAAREQNASLKFEF